MTTNTMQKIIQIAIHNMEMWDEYEHERILEVLDISQDEYNEIKKWGTTETLEPNKDKKYRVIVKNLDFVGHTAHGDGTGDMKTDHFVKAEYTLEQALEQYARELDPSSWNGEIETLHKNEIDGWGQETTILLHGTTPILVGIRQI